MKLVLLAISATCSSFTNVNTSACTHALEAGSKQTGLYQQEEQIENSFTLMAKSNADKYLGPQTQEVVGGAYYVYKTYKDKEINLRLPNMNICDSIDTKLTNNSMGLNFRWSLPNW